MKVIIRPVTLAVKHRLYKAFRSCRDVKTRGRYLIILNLLHGRGAYQTAEVLSIHNTTVYRVAARYRERGEAGLWDRREDNGEAKLDERYLSILLCLVRSCPQQYRWPRPTWTREMLVETMARRTGVRIHVATMSRALKMIKARRGRPRPVVRCPWSKWAKTRRLNRIRLLKALLPKKEVVVYADEVDIHLNPKIGLDWMGPGQQKEVVTPGKNEKRYLAGALDENKRLLWVQGTRKNSDLFLDLLDALAKHYRRARKIHVILDNYRIHTSKIVEAALEHCYKGRIELVFLPPYSPEENRIERVWQDLHGNVTRNHTCKTMELLMLNVEKYLEQRDRELTQASTTPCYSSAA